MFFSGSKLINFRVSHLVTMVSENSNFGVNRLFTRSPKRRRFTLQANYMGLIMNRTELSERECLDLWRRAVCSSVRSDAPDLTARQQAILMTVALTRGPHTVRGLASLLKIAKPAVTRALDTLAKQNLIKRVKDESDLRNVFIERTEEGAQYLRSFSTMIAAASRGEDIDTTAPQTVDIKAA